jgi:hypothetical protein
VAGDAQLLAGSDDRSATLWDVRQERCAATYRCMCGWGQGQGECSVWLLCCCHSLQPSSHKGCAPRQLIQLLSVSSSMPYSDSIRCPQLHSSARASHTHHAGTR